MIRPEIGYADAKAFDLGRKNYLWAGRRRCDYPFLSWRWDRDNATP